MFKIILKFAMAMGTAALLLAMVAIYHILFQPEVLAAAGKYAVETEYAGHGGTVTAERKNVESTESIESAENVENTENIESTESIESAENVENTENIESTENAEGTENIESTESVESTENIGNTENTGNTDSAADIGNTENTENTGNIEKTKTLYLTFDDGPSVQTTPRVLDILKERNIKATFFIVGKYAERYPEIVKRIAEEGHTVGIHSYSHDYGYVYSSVEAFVADFDRAHQAVYDASGVDARIFRFPGGSKNSFNGGTRDSIIQEMTNRGYKYFDWNASVQDAVAGVTPERVLSEGIRTAHKSDNPIMLAHDVVPATVEMLETLLDSLPEYEVKPITDDVVPIHF